VSSANALYSFLASLVLEAHALNLPIAVENPVVACFGGPAFANRAIRFSHSPHVRRARMAGGVLNGRHFNRTSSFPSAAFVLGRLASDNTFHGGAARRAPMGMQPRWKQRIRPRWPWP
jgi:hypothetical protein